MPELIAIKSDLKRFDGWTEAFKNFNVEVIDWCNVVDKNQVDYALVWEPGPAVLSEFPNLKIIFSVAAGLDHLKGKNILPAGIPVVRMVETGLTAGMIEYVLFTVLRFHRFMPQYEQNQKDKVWNQLMQVPASKRTVGILGLGELGGSCARTLAQLGFNLVGWSRNPRSISGIACYHGRSQLESVLEVSEILVCILPLTAETKYLINADTLALLPRGAYLINAGRGGCQVEVDIIAALDSGQLAGAALDVFETEPLPENSPVWNHPKIYFTPHIASMVTPQTSAIHVYDNIVNYRDNQPLTHLADMQAGY
jgi:glyoxylate/hydroxypyruvate reductase A